MVRPYIPDVGDIVWPHFDPQAGHEQTGHGPALVLSPSQYNGKTSLMLCCPITTQVKGYPFEVCLFPSSSLGMRYWKLQLPDRRQARACRLGFPSWSLGTSAKFVPSLVSRELGTTPLTQAEKIAGYCAEHCPPRRARFCAGKHLGGFCQG